MKARYARVTTNYWYNWWWAGSDRWHPHLSRCSMVTYGEHDWPSYSRWMVPGTDEDTA